MIPGGTLAGLFDPHTDATYRVCSAEGSCEYKGEEQGLRGPVQAGVAADVGHHGGFAPLPLPCESKQSQRRPVVNLVRPRRHHIRYRMDRSLHSKFGATSHGDSRQGNIV